VSVRILQAEIHEKAEGERAGNKTEHTGRYVLKCMTQESKHEKPIQQQNDVPKPRKAD
jgi:hypothetical protein